MKVVTLEDLKEHLGLTADFGAADDAMIERKIAAATRHVEAATGLVFAETYASATEVPEDLKEAIRMLAAHLYENREASLVGVTASTVPFGFDDFIRPHRKGWF